MNEPAPFIRKGQIWKVIDDCNAHIQFLFTAPITFSGSCRLTTGERVRIMTETTDSEVAVLNFLPVRYDELHDSLVPLDIRDTPRYKKYMLSMKTGYFYEHFRLIEDMIAHDAIRYTRIPLKHGSGALPAVGFGTLIPDPVATKQAVKIALEVGFRHFDCAERYRNEEVVGDAMQEVFKILSAKLIFLSASKADPTHETDRFFSLVRTILVDVSNFISVSTFPAPEFENTP